MARQGLCILPGTKKLYMERVFLFRFSVVGYTSSYLSPFMGCGGEAAFMDPFSVASFYFFHATFSLFYPLSEPFYVSLNI